MPLSISTGMSKSMGFTSGASAPQITFPLGSIVPYYGTTIPTLADWTLYGTGANLYIAGTTNAGLLQGTAAGRSASVFVNSTSTAGAHTGDTYFISGAWKSGASNLNNTANGSVGGHSHSAGSLTFSSGSVPKVNVRLIRANKATPTMPAGTLGFRDTLYGTYGTRFYPNEYTGYLVNGSTGGTQSGSSTFTGQRSTSSAGTHQHNSNNFLFLTGSGNPTALSAGSHSHQIQASMTQSIMSNTRILSAWTSATSRVPVTGSIVMYNGTLGDLTGTGWYLCDGTNGTLDMNDYFLGLDSGNNWGGILSSDASLSTPTVDSGDSAGHQHNTGSTGGSGVVGYHPYQAWTHYHTVTTTSFLDFLGTKFYLHFIQYKG